MGAGDAVVYGNHIILFSQGAGTFVADVDPANGDVLAWRSTLPIPSYTNNIYIGATIIDNFVVVPGIPSSAVATIGTDGSLVSWNEAPGTNAPIIWARAVTHDGRRVYAVGGGSPYQAHSSVEMATLASDGSLGAWSYLTPLPVPIQDGMALVEGGFLYAFGGIASNPGGDSTYSRHVFRAPLNPDGTIGLWQFVGLMLEKRMLGTYLRFGDSIHIIGGGVHSFMTATVESVPVAELGNTSSHIWSAPLPVALNEHAAATVGRFGYVLGGNHRQFGGGPQDKVYVTELATNSESISTTFCSSENFDTSLGSLQFSFIGDADQGGAAVDDGRVELTSDGSSLYHGTDNGGFLHQSVSGDFRVEVRLDGFPDNAGGGYRRSGIAIRTGSGASDPRVFVEYLPMHPAYGQPALMFDYRGLDGVAKELASTKLGLQLPIYLAIDRRGNRFTVGYSTDDSSWVKPAGAAGGSVTIAMPSTVEVGILQASYDSSTTLTSAFDKLEICQPNPEPLPALPPEAACSSRPIDLVYLLDASGSATTPFPDFASKLAAANTAIFQLNSRIAQSLPGSRAALITYQGGPAPAYNTGAGATLQVPLGSNFEEIEAAAMAIEADLIHSSTSSPLSHAIKAAGLLFSTQANQGFRPVVVLLGDGFVNVDENGYGPTAYRTSEMQAISVTSGFNYRTVGEVGWLGNWNGPISTWDGEALANVMDQVIKLKAVIPDVAVYAMGLRSGTTYREDLLAFLADYGSGSHHEATGAVTLNNAVLEIFDRIYCEP